MIKRPSAAETDEDLIRQNNELLKSKKITNNVDKIIPTEETDNRLVGILGDVIERTHRIDVTLNQPDKISDGFPAVFVVDPASKNIHSGKRKKSLFARKLGIPENEPDEAEIPKTALPPTNQDIHEENVEKLANMSKEEIIEEKTSLEKSLSPDLLNFLKNRAVAKNPAPKTTQKQSSPPSEDFSHVEANLRETFDQDFLESNKIELEKLQWTGDIPDATSLQPGETYSARFDFSGDLQPFKTEIDVRKSLHQHGEEPDRPGYTIQELYHFSRSKVRQQRITALTTLANIIRKAKMGYYDCCFDGVLLEKLVDSDLFFLLRFSMDENSTTAAAVHCLHELFVSRSDEVCLDRLLNFSLDYAEPFLYVPLETDADTQADEMKDATIIAQDLVRGVLRTDLLVRFSYILSHFQLDPITVSKIFDIVIRVCRHSAETCQTVFESGIWAFATSNPTCPRAVKLLRVLAASSSRILKEMAEKIDFAFLPRILDNDEPHFQLKLECLALWRLFLRKNHLTELFQTFTPCFGRLLSFYVAKVDVVHGRFDFELFAGILSVITSVLIAKNPVDPMYEHPIQICLEKWMTQLMKFKGKMNYSVAKALAAIYNFFLVKFDQGVMKTDLIFLDKLSQVLNNYVEFSDIICDDLLKFSHIVCFKNVVRDPKNLSSLCSVYRDGENYLKSVQDESPWPFIGPFAEFLLKIYTISNCLENQLVRLKNSLEKFSERFFKHPECSSWFTRYELDVFIAVLKIKRKFSDGHLMRFGFRMIPYFRTDDDRVLTVLDTISHPCISQVFYSHLANIVNRVHNHSCENFSRHWMYEPISVSTRETLKSLTTILVNFPDLLSNVSPTLRFCHICLVLLNGENIFVPEIRNNLETCFQDVLTNLDQIDLTNIAISEKTFYELYRDLALEFAGCSYGDELFAKIVALPLCQRFDVSYRKLMWSEMMHALRVITLPNNVNFVSVDIFTTPVETDESLLVLYLNSVMFDVLTENRNGFLYAVAVESVRKYLNFSGRDENVAKVLRQKINRAKNEKLKAALLT